MKGEIYQLLLELKESCPEFSITEENIIHPTPEFVMKLYSYFLTQFQEQLNYILTDSYYMKPEDEGFDEKIKIFLQMSLLFRPPNQVTLTLQDIYDPNSIRTKIFLKLCIHFKNYVDSIKDYMKMNFASVADKSDKIVLLERERYDLLEELEKEAVKKAELTQLIEEKMAFYEELIKSYKNFDEQKRDEEQVNAAMEKELNELTVQYENLCENFKELETKELQLAKEVISDETYQNVKAKIEKITQGIESTKSEETDVETILSQEHLESLRYLNCLQKISNGLKFDGDLCQALECSKQELKQLIIENNESVKKKQTLISMIADKEKSEKYLRNTIKKMEVEINEISKMKEVEVLKNNKMKLVKEIEDVKHSKGMNSDAIEQLCQAQIRLNEKIMKAVTEVKQKENEEMEEVVHYINSLK